MSNKKQQKRLAKEQLTSPSLMIKQIDPHEVEEVLAKCEAGTKAYFGADSSRFKIDGVWYADYAVVLVIHINGKNGCKIFGEVTREVDLDRSRSDRPFNRMMTETAKVIELYNKLKPYIEPYILSIPDFDLAIHLDINPNIEYGSSCAVSSAVGLVKATCNIEPMIKPLAPMASYAADRFKEVASNNMHIRAQTQVHTHSTPPQRPAKKKIKKISLQSLTA